VNRLRLLVVLAAFAWTGCGAQRALLGTEGSFLLTAMDALTVPGQATDLGAQLRGGDFLRAQAGYAIRFHHRGKLHKVAETDDDGVAAVSFTPTEPGDYEFAVEVAPTGLAEDAPPPARLHVACRAPDTRLAVVDLDQTIVAGGFHTVLIGTPAPMPGSQGVLKRLARDHTVVYLTHRPDYFSVKSKAWLRDSGYPPGPLLLSTLGGFLKGSGAFKSDMLARLSKQFRRLEIGIGDKISDAQAYHQRGMKSILILPMPQSADPGAYTRLADDLAGLDEAVQVVTDWKQVERALFGGGTFPRSAAQQRLRQLAEAAEAKAKAAGT
jgi:hypothetical protein